MRQISQVSAWPGEYSLSFISLFNFEFTATNVRTQHYITKAGTRCVFTSCSPGEAVGHLLCVSKQSSLRLSVQSQADKTVRSLWAEPSAQGAHVVATVLCNPAHLVEW